MLNLLGIDCGLPKTFLPEETAKIHPYPKLIKLPTVPAKERPKILGLTLWRSKRFSKWIDLGCEEAGSTRNLHIPPWMERINVDVVKPKSNLPGRFVQADIREFVGNEEFGESCLVSLLDAIEHLSKEEGLMVLEKLEEKTGGLILSSPDGFFPLDGTINPEITLEMGMIRRGKYTLVIRLVLPGDYSRID